MRNNRKIDEREKQKRKKEKREKKQLRSIENERENKKIILVKHKKSIKQMI